MTFDTDANNVRRRLHRSKLHFYRFGMGKKQETCVGCSQEFEYQVKRTGVGVGHSPFLLLNSTAKEKARERASHHLSRSLDKAMNRSTAPTVGYTNPRW